VPDLMSREEMLDQTGKTGRDSTPTSEELSGTMQAEITSHETESSQFLDRFRTYDEMWRCVPTDIEGLPPDAYFAKTSTMEVFRNTETVYANMYARLFGEEPYFMAESEQQREEAEQAVSDWQDVLQDQVRDMGFRTRLSPSLRCAILNGTAVVGTPWKTEYRWNDAGKTYERVLVEDRPDVEYVDLLAFHRQPYALDIPDAKWVIEERDTDEDDLRKQLAAAKQFEGAFVDEGALDEALSMKSSGGTDRQNDLRQSRGYSNAGESDKVHLDVRWGLSPFDKKSPIIWKYLRVNRSRVVARIPNPFREGYKPYIRTVFYPLPNSFYGMGLGWLLHRPQVENNMFRALLRTKFALWVYGMWLSVGGGVGPDEAILPRPGGVIDGSRLGNLTQLPVDLNGMNVGMQLEHANNEQMRFSVVANPSAQASVTGVSATEVRDVSVQTNVRNQPGAQQLADTLIRPVLERFVQQNRQFLPEEIVSWKLGEDGRYRARTILTDTLPEKVKIFIKVGPDPDFVVQTLRRLTSFIGEVAQSVQAFPEIREEGFSIVPFIKRIARNFGENPMEVFNPRLKKERQDLMAAQMQNELLKTKLAAHAATDPAARPEVDQTLAASPAAPPPTGPMETPGGG
jgi:hypothetical protein